MSVKKTVLLVGGGHAHALFLKLWQKKSVPHTQLVVIDSHEQVPYTGMLPGFVAGHYGVEDLYINLKQLTVSAGGTLVNDRVSQINLEEKTVCTASGTTYKYDVLSVDVGIHGQLHIPGFADYAVAIKPLYDFAQRWEEFLVETKNNQRSANIIVIGAGVAGVELALAMSYRLQQKNITATVTCIERGNALQAVGRSTQQYLRRLMQERGIRLIEQTAVINITADKIQTSSGVLTSDFTLAAAGPAPYHWVAKTGLVCTGGYINVTETLQTAEYPAVFAVGDCAHFVSQPLQKAGVYAVHQAPILHHNVQAFLQGTPLQKYRPQKDYLKLISLGGKEAAADKWGWCWHGAWLWRLKNIIDTSFMNSVSQKYKE